MNKRKTKIFIISGPSGAGEDSVIEALHKKIAFNRVITTVTRKPLRGERQGRPYYFISIPQFKKLIAQKQLVEWAMVYGDYRGCTRRELNRLLKLKKPILWKVDWHGVRDIKKFLPEAVAIFIAPPSYEILEERLRRRGRDSLREIKRRKKFTQEWLKHKNIYDYVVINYQGKFRQTVQRAAQIIKKELPA